MAKILWTLVLLLSAQLVASQGSGQCGLPVVNEDKVLEERYAGRSVFNDGDRVAHKCAKGYRPAEGNRVSYCWNGKWLPLNMRCTRKQCGSAGEIENGRYEQNGNLFGDKAYAKCDEGFVLKGESVRECLDDGWSGTVPSCEAPPLARSYLPAPNGPRGCQPPELKNFKIIAPKNKYVSGESLSYFCNVGHLPAGNLITKCKPSGKWAPPPRCTVIKCPKLNIRYATLNTTRVKFNETVKITCNDGYQLRGPNLITCTGTGSWAPAVPTCESVVRCPAPAVANGRTQDGDRTDYSVGDRVTIVCENSYVLNGPPQITCGPDGQWDSVPECRSSTVVRCPAPAVANGRTQDGDRTDYSVGDRVTIVCENSYVLNGPPQITCGPDGQWDSVPECRSSTGKCGRLPHYPDALPRDQHLRQEEYESGVYVRFKCSVGYRWVGGNTRIQCLNGYWTPLDMSCQKKSCGSAGEISNGRFRYTGTSFGDTATAECFEGHNLVGFPLRHCRSEGWDGRVPVCEVVQCPPPPEVPGAQIFDPSDGHPEFGHVVSYSCDSGTLIGDKDIYCTAKGTWSSLPPVCRDVISCPFPEVKFGSRILGFKERYRPKDFVMFTCNPGMKLEGFGTVSCGSDGKWTPDLPTCVPLAARRSNSAK